MHAYKLNIGDATHYLKWDGEKLTVKGLFGDITLENTGFVRTSGKDNYADLTAGFFLGYDGGAYKLNIGNDTKYIKWDGATLTIKGMTAFGSITLDSNGFIKTTGKDSYADNTAGFWLGYEDGKYKLNIGNASNWIKWTGTELQIKGRLYVGNGTTDDIYFSGAGIRIYDGATSIAMLKIGGTGLQFSFSSGIAKINTTSNTDLVLSNSGGYDYKFWRHGGFQMANIANEPTGHAGDIAYNSTQHRFQMYVGGGTNAWGYEMMTAGW